MIKKEHNNTLEKSQLKRNKKNVLVSPAHKELWPCNVSDVMEVGKINHAM